MDTNEVWARCGDCGTELKQSDKQCPKCGSTKKAYSKKLTAKLGISTSFRAKQKRKGKGTIIDMISNRWKRSGDSNLKNGNMVIDKDRNEFHHITRDAKTGEITHEEHEPLTKHHKKKPK